MKAQKSGNVPQIRFKEFEGKWEDERIGEVLSEKKRPIVLKDHQRYELITVKRRNEGIVSRGHLFGRDILVKNYAQLQAGDFVISKRQVVHGATGMIPPELDGAIVSNEYLVAVNSSKLLTEFLTILASLPDMRQKFFLSSYGVDIEKLFFDVKDWQKRNVTIPGLTEQARIGEYFRELDRLIGLHQGKHDKLVALKKTMLQKMFPRSGATTPEIRFKGFSGDWVEKKLGECVLIQRGGSPRPIENFITQDPSGINWVKIGDVKIGSRYITKTKEKIKPEGMTKSREVFKGDLILSNSMSFGRPYLMAIDGCIHDGWLLIRNDKNLFDLDYLLQILSSETMTEQYRSLAAGGVVNNLNSALVQSTVIAFPDKPEQQKIGAYFRTLDELISKHAIQLQKLQQIKSACLEKMFV